MNQISEIEGISHLSKVECLSFHGNNISDFSRFASDSHIDHPKLVEVYLYNNVIPDTHRPSFGPDVTVYWTAP